jgi:hypothetical protein
MERASKKENPMEKPNQDACECEKASCGCAGGKVERCVCGERCACSAGCGCAGGCGCGGEEAK